MNEFDDFFFYKFELKSTPYLETYPRHIDSILEGYRQNILTPKSQYPNHLTNLNKQKCLKTQYKTHHNWKTHKRSK